MERRNPFDALLDENCTDTVYLMNDNNEEVAFEQMAIIPFENRMYAILVEKELFDKGELDEAGMVFLIDEEKNNISLVNNVNIISEVFEIYDRLFDEKVND